MKIYHGSSEIVNSPEIRHASRTLDYGEGFYATTSLDQARKWVLNKMDNSKSERGYVNIYELDKGKMAGMKCLIFERPDEKWLDFVMKNRTIIGFDHDNDIVYGPVANDKVYAAFGMYEGGLIDKKQLIKELKAYKLVDQYLFHTERALSCISFISAEEVML